MLNSCFIIKVVSLILKHMNGLPGSLNAHTFAVDQYTSVPTFFLCYAILVKIN